TANSVTVNLKNNSKNYKWQDINPASGNHYYRIRSINLKGDSKYSNIVMVKTGKTASGISVYPNPVSAAGVISIDFSNMAAGLYHFTLVDHFGRIILIKHANHTAGASVESLQADHKLMPGIYHLEISMPG